MANIQVLGKLGKDVEIKTVGQSTVAQFSLAETVGFGDKKTTIWYDVSIWGKRAESGLIDYLNKGREVLVFGELTTQEHNGKTYLKVNCNDIKLTQGTKENTGSQQSQPQNQGYAQKPQQQSKPADDGDELPFLISD